MELNNNKGQVTVIINTSFSEDTNLVKEFVMNEQCPFIESQNEGGLQRFEWFFDETNKTGTLIEIFESPDAFEQLANKVIGTPVNLKFGELFSVDKMTILGEVTNNLKEKLQAMDPIIKHYVGGIS